ncbi:MAG: AF1514 family protein [gamma proteobacterium symbiont of Taylorina sp.]|nr:AF1514 family protein [gamma proteobacterium symbiont of Taylorina sp.]
MSEKISHCNIQPHDYSNVEIVDFTADVQIDDYQAAMQRANQIAEEKLEDYMLLSWYDRDRDFESPQHSSECHENSAIPGYVDYGIYHGACLKIDFEKGRFVFFYASF